MSETKQYSEMSPQERYDHINKLYRNVESQIFMNGGAKVSDPTEKKTTRFYRVTAGDWSLSGWCKTEKEARKEADKNVEKILTKTV